MTAEARRQRCVGLPNREAGQETHGDYLFSVCFFWKLRTIFIFLVLPCDFLSFCSSYKLFYLSILLTIYIYIFALYYDFYCDSVLMYLFIVPFNIDLLIFLLLTKNKFKTLLLTKNFHILALLLLNHQLKWLKLPLDVK